MKTIYSNRTREQKEKWLTAYFEKFPLSAPIDLKYGTDIQVDDLHYQYQSHCAIHGIKIICMERLSELKPVFLDEIPYIKEHGILYVSKKYNIVIHLCACGCLEQSVTPIGNGQWNLTINGDKCSLAPSIGNFSGEKNYHAHYFIRDNKIEWC